MQGMLDNLSQPVAFATVPLGDPEPTNPSLPEKKAEDARKDGNLSSDTDVDEPIFSRFTRKIGMSRDGSKGGRSRKNSHETQNAISRTSSFDEDDGDFEDFLDEGVLPRFSHSELCSLPSFDQGMICQAPSS